MTRSFLGLLPPPLTSRGLYLPPLTLMFLRLLCLPLIFPTMDLKLLQWNCQSFHSKRPELEFRSQAYDLILLSETWIGNDDRLILPQFDTVKFGRTEDSRESVAILIKRGLKYQRSECLSCAPSGLECCANDIFLDGKKTSIISCYRPPGNPISTQSWIRFLTSFDNDFILGGDLNAHHFAWGDLKCCSEGSHLFDALLQSEAIVVNQSQPIYCNFFRNCQSAIDLTLASFALAPRIHWEVFADTWDSDHFPISASISGSAASFSRSFTSSRLHSVRSDWTVIRASLASSVPLSREVIQDSSLDI